MMTDNVTMEELIERLRNAITTGTADLPVPVGFAITSMDQWEFASPSFVNVPSPKKLTEWSGHAEDTESTCNLDEDIEYAKHLIRCTNPDHKGPVDTLGPLPPHPRNRVPPSLERAITNLAARLIKETRDYLVRINHIRPNPARLVWVFSRKAPITVRLNVDECHITILAALASR